MSNRCGAACGPKHTASQGRTPACAQALPRPGAVSWAPPTDPQTPPHPGANVACRQMPTLSDRSLLATSHAHPLLSTLTLGSSSEAPPTKAASHAPCQLRDSPRTIAPPLLSISSAHQGGHKSRLLRAASTDWQLLVPASRNYEHFPLTPRCVPRLTEPQGPPLLGAGDSAHECRGSRRDPFSVQESCELRLPGANGFPFSSSSGSAPGYKSRPFIAAQIVGPAPGPPLLGKELRPRPANTFPSHRGDGPPTESSGPPTENTHKLHP